jgi:enamine deaminase RidA (YjgF/YER057c/UK114 family)
VKLERVEVPSLEPSRGYSHAMAVDGPSRLIFLAGHTALDASGAMVGNTVVEQFERALSNLLASLAAAGGAPTDLASMTIFVVGLGSYRAETRAIGAIWRRLAGEEYPAMAVIGVTRLWDEAALVELQAVAATAVPSDPDDAGGTDDTHRTGSAGDTRAAPDDGS